MEQRQGYSNLGGGSLGAQRVRESFNPSGNEMVDKVKRYTADLIDLCEDLKRLEPRLAALAQTRYEEAAMWAVKAATTDQATRTDPTNPDQALRQASDPLNQGRRK